MTLWYREYRIDDEAIRDIEHLKTEGVLAKDIYVFTDGTKRTDDIVKMAKVNKVGVTETGINAAISNLFSGKEATLQNQFEELGFSEAEAENLEKTVGEQKVVVVVKNMPEGFSF